MNSTRTEWTWPRSLAPEDLREIRSLFDETLKTETTIGFASPLSDEQAASYLTSLQEGVASGSKRIMLGRRDGSIVVMVLLTPNSQPNCVHLGELSKCIIRPSHRGGGILLEGFGVLLRECQATGIEVLVLDVRKGSRAEALWHKLGFAPYGELADYARVNGQVEAGVFMSGAVAELLGERGHSAHAARQATPDGSTNTGAAR